MYHVYIVECNDKTLYAGSTSNLQKRMVEHNSSTKGAKYTMNRRPVVLRYSEELPTLGDALKREYQIKQLQRTQKIALIKSKKLVKPKVLKKQS